jgi:hypothetical protein
LVSHGSGAPKQQVGIPSITFSDKPDLGDTFFVLSSSFQMEKRCQ